MSSNTYKLLNARQNYATRIIPLGDRSVGSRAPNERIRAAEHQVRAVNVGIGVAMGYFLPRIGLTTFYGSTSPELHNLVSSHANVWSAAATAAGPLTGRYHQEKAAFEEAKLDHQQATLAPATNH
jgi:outer membrane protein TolC